jgi:hypothetical protein
MAHVFGDNEKESDYGYVYKVSGPRKSPWLSSYDRATAGRASPVPLRLAAG